MLVWLLIVGGLATASAQDFRIIKATLDASSRPHVEFPGDANFYYVLKRGTDPAAMTNSVALLLGSDGQMEFTGAALNPAPSAVTSASKRSRSPCQQTWTGTALMISGNWLARGL